MLCEKCKKREARINIVKIVNGKKQETWLCEECAKEIYGIPSLDAMISGEGSPLSNILTGFISGSSKESMPESRTLICPKCGLTYDEYKNTKKLGCSTCYRVFKNEIESEINKQRGTSHIGKVPKYAKKTISRRENLQQLRKKMQEYVVSEEYEKAAVVRDEIKELETAIIKQVQLDESLGQREDDQDGKLD
ncbi:UvrB/UvrC motif-containing protein [Clostridium sp. BJN0001]|uniref:UvrB/UvrC motif-containing protein n=1 Tax=Clostridium sp. BJN0001 TaxID=2930219 RepID=UPI001FCFE701|nr:UvrB/UvrC motif-containing protein [Clostridium sp. BJN0001]